MIHLNPALNILNHTSSYCTPLNTHASNYWHVNPLRIPSLIPSLPAWKPTFLFASLTLVPQILSPTQCLSLKGVAALTVSKISIARRSRSSPHQTLAIFGETPMGNHGDDSGSSSFLFDYATFSLFFFSLYISSSPIFLSSPFLFPWCFPTFLFLPSLFPSTSPFIFFLFLSSP